MLTGAGTSTRSRFAKTLVEFHALDVMRREPIEYSAQDVFLVRELFDRVAFVGIHDHLRFGAGRFQGSIVHPAHRQWAAAVVGGVQDQGWGLHSRHERQRAVVAHELRNFPGRAAEFPFGPALDVGQAPHGVEIGNGVLWHGGSELVGLADQ